MEQASGTKWQARRYCTGDESWTDWRDINDEEYNRRKDDSSFQFRRV